MPCFRFITGALLRYLAGLVDTSLVCTAPKVCSTGATDPADMAPADASSLKNSCALIADPYNLVFDPPCGPMFNPVIPGTELRQTGSYGFDSYLIPARNCLDLQYLLQVLVSPDPGAFSEQFVVDEHPVHRWQAFPVTVNVKHSANVHSIHAVFMGSFWYLGGQFAGLTHDHIAVIVLLAYDPARLLRIARHHGGVHVLSVASLFETQAHCIGL